MMLTCRKKRKVEYDDNKKVAKNKNGASPYFEEAANVLDLYLVGDLANLAISLIGCSHVEVKGEPPCKGPFTFMCDKFHIPTCENHSRVDRGRGPLSCRLLVPGDVSHECDICTVWCSQMNHVNSTYLSAIGFIEKFFMHKEYRGIRELASYELSHIVSGYADLGEDDFSQRGIHYRSEPGSGPAIVNCRVCNALLCMACAVECVGCVFGENDKLTVSCCEAHIEVAACKDCNLTRPSNSYATSCENHYTYTWYCEGTRTEGTKSFACKRCCNSNGTKCADCTNCEPFG